MSYITVIKIILSASEQYNIVRIHLKKYANFKNALL